MFYLGKIFILLVSPLGLFIFVAPLSVLMMRRYRKTASALLTLAFAWLVTWSLPVASIWLRDGLERQVPLREATDYPTADAIVVLGGGVEGGRTGYRSAPHLLAGADRVWFGSQLLHAGRAPLLIISGGNSEWSVADEPEARGMQTFARDLGVPDSAFLIEDGSRNTQENATYTRELMAEHHIKTVLLVTSALHMPRALLEFRAQGIDVTPAPTDFDAIPARSAWLRWMPDAEALDRSSKAIKEYIGIWIHRLKNRVA